MKIISTNSMPLGDGELALGNAETAIPESPKNVALFSKCRDAIFMAAKYCPVPGKRVLIPAYTCATTYMPFEELGWELFFYPVTRDLRIAKDAFSELLKTVRPSIVLAPSYYGADLNDQELELLAAAKRAGAFVIEDLTQSAFSTQNADVVDAFVGSVRKWFPMPDGGFLRSDKLPYDLDRGLPEDEKFLTHEKCAMRVFARYLESGDPALLAAVRILEKDARSSYVNPCRMADFSRRIYAAQDDGENSRQRMENCRYLYERLKNSKTCKVVWTGIDQMTTGPLWFPIYVADKKRFRLEVANPAGFTAPGLWPVESEQVLVNDDMHYIYQHIVGVTCGQMYDQNDMERIAQAIESWKI